MSAQHTPEPWPEFESVAMKSKVCDMDVVELGVDNYNHASACVNACARLSDADIATITEHGGVVELYNAVPDLVATVHRLRDVEQQRDELLAALRDIITAYRELACDEAEPVMHRIAVEAIAKHRGQK